MSRYLIVKPLSITEYAVNQEFNDKYPVGVVIEMPEDRTFSCCDPPTATGLVLLRKEIAECMRKL